MKLQLVHKENFKKKCLFWAAHGEDGGEYLKQMVTREERDE